MLQSAASLAQSTSFASAHVCLRQPCAYCMVSEGKDIPAGLLVAPIPAENRVIVERIVHTLIGIDKPLLLALEFVIEGWAKQATAEEHTRPALRLAVSGGHLVD